jgi:hypothetical protein
MPTYGLLDTRDLQVANLRIAAVGEDRLFEALDEQLVAYNALMDELLGALTAPTRLHQRRFGASGSGEMLPAAEYSRFDAQHIGPGQTLGFPIDRYGYALGWTRDYLRRATVGEVQKQADEAKRADFRLIIRLIKLALFTPTNSTFIDPVYGSTPVKALINADSSFIPDYDGVTFNAATHTHYITSGGTTFTQANETAVEKHIYEHGIFGNLVLYINPDQEADVRAMTKFVPRQDPYIVNPLGEYARVSDNDYLHTIGRVGYAEVRKRNWMPTGYIFMYNEYGDGSELNPLARRLADDPELNEDNLVIVGQDERFPLRAQWMERFIGFGAYNRLNGVVMQVTASGTYTAPTL